MVTHQVKDAAEVQTQAVWLQPIPSTVTLNCLSNGKLKLTRT